LGPLAISLFSSHFPLSVAAIATSMWQFDITDGILLKFQAKTQLFISSIIKPGCITVPSPTAAAPSW